MIDLSQIGPVALEGTDAVLVPVFDPRLRTFSVQLWEHGTPSRLHGLLENFRYADEPVASIDGFLAEQGLRALTEDESARLYAGLVQTKGGPDWTLLLMSIGADEAHEQD